MKKQNTSTIVVAAFAFGISCVMTMGCGNKNSGSSGDGDNGRGGGDANPTDLPDTPLAGVVQGQPWTAVVGLAEPAPGDTDELWLQFSNVPVERVCDHFAWQTRDESRVILTSKPQTGLQKRDEASGESMTISIHHEDFMEHPTRNLIGFGALELTEITRSEVRGKVNVYFDEDNHAKGSFTVKRCMDQFGKPEDEFVADAQPDPALVGSWGGPLVIIDTVTDWMWTLVFDADGTATVRLVESSGGDIEDADETWVTDTGVVPHRLIRTVTKVRTDVNGLEQLGTKEYCVYAVTGSKVVMDCGTSSFPSDLSTAASADMVLTRQ